MDVDDVAGAVSNDRVAQADKTERPRVTMVAVVEELAVARLEIPPLPFGQKRLFVRALGQLFQKALNGHGRLLAQQLGLLFLLFNLDGRRRGEGGGG